MVRCGLAGGMFPPSNFLRGFLKGFLSTSLILVIVTVKIIVTYTRPLEDLVHPVKYQQSMIFCDTFHKSRLNMIFQFNLLWPSNTIWWHRSGSTLTPVMAWCLMAPSHYLNQCWLIIKSVHVRTVSQEVLLNLICDMGSENEIRCFFIHLYFDRKDHMIRLLQSDITALNRWIHWIQFYVTHFMKWHKCNPTTK